MTVEQDEAEQPGRVVHTGQVLIDLTMAIGRLPAAGDEVFADSFSLEVGGGFNVLRAARRAGVIAEYAGGIGEGPLADIARVALETDGIVVSGYEDASLDTGFRVAITVADAERTFLSTRGAELATPEEAFDGIELGVADVLYIAGHSMLDDRPRVALLRLVDRLVADRRSRSGDAPGRPAVVVDPSTVVGSIPVETLESVARLRPVWTMNIREAGIVCALLGVEPEDHTMEHREGAVLALALTDRLRSSVIVRGGASGAWLAREGLVDRIPSIEVEAVDTNGAGDAHTGVVCAELARGANLEEAVARANVAAAISVTRSGTATTPSRDEVERVLVEQVEGATRDAVEAMTRSS